MSRYPGSPVAAAGRQIVNAGDDDMTPEERADRARIARLRERNRLRAEKFIQNPWQRKVGVDIDALNAQVAEKQARKEAEAERERQYAMEQKEVQKQMAMMDMQVRYGGADTGAQFQNYWKQQLREKKEREAAIRVQDDQMASGSFMEFAGEDRFMADRKRMQQMQQQRWAEQQIAEKEQRKKAEADERMAEHQKYVMQTEIRTNNDMEEMLRRKKLADATAAQNRLLASVRRERLAMDKAQDEILRYKANEAMKNAGILSENPDLAHSALGAGRIRGDHFRGFTKAQLQEFKAEQAAQMEEHKRRKQAEENARKQEQRQMREMQKQLDIMQLQAEDEDAAYQAQYQAQLNEQRRQQIEARKLEAKARGSKAFSDGFFGGFGMSAR